MGHVGGSLGRLLVPGRVGDLHGKQVSAGADRLDGEFLELKLGHASFQFEEGLLKGAESATEAHPDLAGALGAGGTKATCFAGGV